MNGHESLSKILRSNLVHESSFYFELLWYLHDSKIRFDDVFFSNIEEFLFGCVFSMKIASPLHSLLINSCKFVANHGKKIRYEQAKRSSRPLSLREDEESIERKGEHVSNSDLWVRFSTDSDRWFLSRRHQKMISIFSFFSNLYRESLFKDDLS